MPLFNVIQPCIVGNLHHTRPTTQPIEVDDDTATPLVEAGCLEPYEPGVERPEIIPGPTGTVLDDVVPTVVEAGREAGEEFARGVVSDELLTPARRPRRPKA